MQDNNSKQQGPPLALVAVAGVALALVLHARWPLVVRVAHDAVTVALVAAAAAVVLTVVRLAVMPAAARRNVPRTLLARLRWRWLARNCGLSYPDPASKGKDKIRHPRARFRSTAHGFTVAIRTTPRVSRKQVQDQAEHLADAFGVHRCAVTKSGPSRIELRALRVDPLAVPFGPEGCPAGTWDHPDAARPYLGLSSAGESRYLSWRNQTLAVVGGSPGRGKTSLIGSLLSQWAPLESVQVATLNGKGGDDLSVWDDRAWMHSGDDLADAVTLLEDFHSLMRHRLATVLEVTGYRNAWHAPPSAAWPMVWLIMDECGQYLDVLSYKGDREREALARRCVALTSEIVRKGRSCMVGAVVATQKPTSDQVPSQISGQAGIALSFGVKTTEAAAAVLGPDIREWPLLSPVGLRDDSMVGVVASNLETGLDPFTWVRTPNLPESWLADRAAATAHLRADPTQIGAAAVPILAALPSDVAA